MKLKIGICDDLKAEQLQLAAHIRTYCAEHGMDVGIRLFSSGEELLDVFQPGMFHILFLDIYMNEMDGIRAARNIRKTDQTCAIIFATTSEDHGLVSYEVQASDYLLKPICAEDVASAMDWCVEQISSTYRMLDVVCETGTVCLPLRDIHYIEIQGHMAMLYTDDRTLVTRRGLDELEKEIEKLFPMPQVPAGEILTNLRHAQAVSAALESISAAMEAMELGCTPDIVLTETETAMGALGELSGRSIREDVTNRIFQRFCVGK